MTIAVNQPHNGRFGGISFNFFCKGGYLSLLRCFSLIFLIANYYFRSLAAETPAARDQIGKTVRYDPACVGLDYPGGDLPTRSGVCTDVVILTLRSGLNLDLQQLVHEDMRQNFEQYPQKWGLKRPDTNIDHRRVPNLRTYFERADWAQPHPPALAHIRSGDIITNIVPSPAHPHRHRQRQAAAFRQLYDHP